MRFISRNHKDHVGDVRFKAKFLWFPKRIGDETRWLERVMWRQEYMEVIESFEYADCKDYQWVDVCWEDW